jgi:hypothetical protein
MENEKWKMENETKPGSHVFHFPFSIFHFSFTDHSSTFRKLISSLKSNPSCLAGVIVAALSIAAFFYFFINGMTNVYGDGVAHLNIARKVVDSPDSSLWRRYIQIGSPWLPLQTALMLPLVSNDWLWRTGVAGSIVSMLAFLAAAVAVYLLTRDFYGAEERRWRVLLSVMAVGIFAFNPSVLYMQSTPMTELVFIASLIIAVYLLQRWARRQTAKRLAVAAAGMTIATLARYEAWPVAMLSIAVVVLTSVGDWKSRIKNCALFSVIVATGPIYWLWHNWAIYDNALEFLNGPNSARGVYLLNRAHLGWSTVFVGNAALDILTMTVTAAVCAGPLVLLLSCVGFIRFGLVKRRELLPTLPALLLAVPFFFHVFSLYRGEIQVFPLSVFGMHNVRYGLPYLLPIALFAPGVILLFKDTAKRGAALAVCVIVVAQYGYLVSDGLSQLPIFQEGYRSGVHSPAARELSRAAEYLRINPPNGLILMHTGALGPLVSKGGLTFSEIIHEGTLRWHQIDDVMPPDIHTIIIQKDDPLDLRLREKPFRSDDLSKFQREFSVGNIQVFVRTGN